MGNISEFYNILFECCKWKQMEDKKYICTKDKDKICSFVECPYIKDLKNKFKEENI